VAVIEALQTAIMRPGRRTVSEAKPRSTAKLVTLFSSGFGASGVDNMPA
jgi:hypothetical protein